MGFIKDIVSTGINVLGDVASGKLDKAGSDLVQGAVSGLADTVPGGGMLTQVLGGALHELTNLGGSSDPSQIGQPPMPFGLGGLGPNLFNNSLQNFFNQGFGMQSGFQFPPSFPPIGGGPGQGGQTLQGLQNALQQAVAGGDPNAIKTAVTNLDKFEEGFE